MQSSLGVRDGELALALGWPQWAEQSRSLAHRYSPRSVKASRVKLPGTSFTSLGWDRSSCLGVPFPRRVEQGAGAEQEGVRAREEMKD